MSSVDTGAHRDGGGGEGGQKRPGVSLSLCSHIVLDEALRQGLNACSVLFSWVGDPPHPPLGGPSTSAVVPSLLPSLLVTLSLLPP